MIRRRRRLTIICVLTRQIGVVLPDVQVFTHEALSAIPAPSIEMQPLRPDLNEEFHRQARPSRFAPPLVVALRPSGPKKGTGDH